jgi:hypothetical protein
MWYFADNPDTEIAEIAAQEHALEVGLQKMREEWHSVVFDVIPFRFVLI